MKKMFDTDDQNPVPLVPREKRGIIRHRGRPFGISRLGAPLEVFLPDNGGSGCLVMAGQHGTEPETTVLLSSVLRTLPAGSLMCPVVTCLNPDGIIRGTRGNEAGVDLNRNFPTGNWSPAKVCHNWSTGDPMDTELSPGPEPASEPETRGVISLVEELKPRLIISIHAPLGCIDDPRLSGTGRWLSRVTGLPLVENVGYAVPGSFGTWAIEKGIHLITLELPMESIRSHRIAYAPPLLRILSSSRRGIDELTCGDA